MSTVLVVDDDARIRDLIQFELEREGYRVITAPDGQAALDVVNRAPVDLILLDMRMPVMDGWTFASVYHRQKPPWAPLVVFTANASQRADDIDANGHLDKPFELDDLLSAVTDNLVALPRPTAESTGFAAGARVTRSGPIAQSTRAEASEQRVRSVLESITDAFYALDAGWRLTYVNSAAVELLRHDSDQLLGRNLWEVFPAAIGSEFDTAFRRAMDGRLQVEVQAYYPPFEAWFAVRAFPTDDGGLSVYFRDVTVERQASEAGARLVAIVESSSDAIIGKDLDGTIVSWNPAAERLYGYTAAEAVGRSIAVLVPPDRADETPALLERIRRGERFSQYETEWVHKDRRRLTVSLSLSPVHDAGGTIVGAAIIARDITEQRQRDAALQRYRLFAEHTQDIVFFVGADGTILECNAAAVAACGYDRTELLGLPIGHLASDMLSLAEEQLREVPTGGVTFETVSQRKSGRTFPVEVSCVVAEIETQNVLLVTMRDITQRRASEAVLLAATAQMQTAQKIAHLGSWELDLPVRADATSTSRHWSDVQWSDECFRIYGYEPGEIEVTNEFFLERVHPDDRAAVAAALEKTIHEGLPYSFEHRIVSRDGSERILHQRDELLYDANGRPSRLVGTVQDITRRKQVESEVADLLAATQAARGEAEAAVRTRDEFLLIAAHELRTPLTTIKLAAQGLAARDGQLSPDVTPVDRLIHHLDAGATRLARLTDDLLDVARLQTGRLRVRPEDVNLSDLVQRVAEAYGLRLNPGQHLQVEGVAAACQVLVDPDRLQQVLGNLLDNSIKYSPAGGTINVQVRPEKDECVLHVQDQGMGLPGGSEEAIFQPFGRAKNAGSSHIQGMGLGLYICRQIVASHNGRIWAESAGPNQGTLMHLWLPRADSPRRPGDDPVHDARALAT